MTNEQLKVFSGSGVDIEFGVNEFLKQHASNIEVVEFEVVDNSSASSSSKSSDGRQVFFLMYRPKKTVSATEEE